MKPARFIFSSDYSTVRNTGVTDLSVTIPNSFTIPVSPTGAYYIIGRTSAKIGNKEDSFMVYWSSDKYDYMTNGYFGYTLPDGAKAHSAAYGDSRPDVYIEVDIQGDTATLTARCLNTYPEGSLTFTGYGQTITAHVYTFKDPFSE